MGCLFAYDQNAEWTDAPSKPIFWQEQLGISEETTLNVDKLITKIESLMNALRHWPKRLPSRPCTIQYSAAVFSRRPLILTLELNQIRKVNLILLIDCVARAKIQLHL